MQGCYLIHFEVAYRHATHYLGYSCDLRARIAAHERGNGARLIAVLTRHDIRWQVARIWPNAGRALERKLKARHSGVRLCPVCQGKVAVGYSVDVRRETFQRATTFPLSIHQGKRRPMGGR
jgi:predicted GIY-YIG superfamily endonuclease